ncbi:MAG: ROK family protein [Bacteroidetes bacterium]|nr:ROK family protein [Bacteroidota bacterium]
MTPVAVGIDIGGTNTKYGIVDRNGKALAEASLSTPKYEDINEYVAVVSRAIMHLVDSVPQKVSIKGIGIGAPNGNYFTGTIEYAPNLRWKGVIPLADLFNKHFHVPVVLTNDANAAAIGEMMYGGAKGMDNFSMITLGTGVGSGFVVNGGLIYGHDGFAGEFGHVTAVRDGRLCTCGKKGCVETYASARGLVLTVQELVSASPDDSNLRHILPDELTPKHVFEAAENGDPIAKAAFESTGKILGQSLADMVAYLSPSHIFVFGGVAKAGEWILAPTRRYMEKNLMPIYKNKVKVVPSGLPDTNAAILGASALIWKELD